MADFVADGQPFENPESAADTGYVATSPTKSVVGPLLSSGISGVFGRFSELATAQEQADPAAARQEAFRQAGIDPSMMLGYSGPHLSSKLDPEKANELYSPEGEKLFDAPVAPGVARVMGQQKTDEIKRESILSRWANSTAWPVTLGTSLAVGLLDPLNDAAAFMPGIGEETLLAGLGKVGFATTGFAARTVARAGAGAVSAGAAMVPLVGAEYGMSQVERADYGLRDAFRDVMFGAAFGAIAHAGFGAAGDAFRSGPAPARADAMRGVASQVVDGREVDATQVAPTVTADSVRDALTATMAQDLRGIGLPGDQVVANAELTAAHYATLGKILGRDPEELYRENLQVQAASKADGDVSSEEGGAKEKSFDQPATVPTFYSAVDRAITSAKQAKASPEQWLATLRNTPGVKPEEMQWLGLENWLREQDGPVTREQVADYVRVNRIDVQEVTKGAMSPEVQQRKVELQTQLDSLNARRNDLVNRVTNPRRSLLGRSTLEADKAALAEVNEQIHAVQQETTRLPADDTRYGKYVLPGAEPESYREMLLTLPKQQEENFDIRRNGNVWEVFDRRTNERVVGGTYLDRENAVRYQQSLSDQDDPGGTYRSSHWEEPNILAHVRFNDRVIDGKKTLLVEEVQSDWHQAGRKKGYRQEGEDVNTTPYGWGEAGPTAHAGKVPDAPFKTTWPELALKRIFRYAAENGYDKVAWAPGDVHADRYDLSKQVSELFHWKDEDGDIVLSAYDHDGFAVLDQHYVTPDKLDSVVGKELAQRILDGEGEHEEGQSSKVKVIRGEGLKVGGEGMRGFYDKILPAAANKLVKKFGARVGEDKIEVKGEDQPVHSVDVTPQLRQAAVEQGFPLFQEGQGPAEPRGRVTFRDAGPAIVQLFQSRDASTFAHEAAHVWLDEIMKYAAVAGAPQQLREMRQTILDWFGVDHESEITTVHHEQWARAFERYLRDGKAPTSRLQHVFDQFRQWLTEVYKSILRLGHEVPPDIKAVMDRMLAADDEIAAHRASPPEVASQQRQVYRNGYAQGIPQNEFDAANEAVYGKREEEEAATKPPAQELPKTSDGRSMTPAEAEIAGMEQRLAASGVTFLPEEKAELDATRQGLADAADRSQGIQQARECLTGAGI